MSTQRQKLGGPSQGCSNTIYGQRRQRSNIASEIIIKEGRTQKVSRRLSHLNRRKEREGLSEDLGLQPSGELLRSENWIPMKDSGWIRGTKIPKERLLEISSHR